MKQYEIPWGVRTILSLVHELHDLGPTSLVGLIFLGRNSSCFAFQGDGYTWRRNSEGMIRDTG